MKRPPFLIVSAVTIALLVALFLLNYRRHDPSPAPALPEFTLGFLPAERAEEITPHAEALAAYLSAAMPARVVVSVPTAYEPLVESMRFGHLDAAFMDSGPAWLAHRRAGAEAALAEVNDGVPYYWGELFARAESTIDSLDDLPGTRIAFTSWTGSSGFVFPIGAMINEGLISPARRDFTGLQDALNDVFRAHTVSGGYAQSLQLLIQGQVDVAGGAHDAPTRFLEEEDRAKVKSVLRLGKVPSHPVMVAAHVPPGLRDAFVAAMLTLNEDAHRNLLTNLYGVDGLIPTDTETHLSDFGPAFEAVAAYHTDSL